MGAAGQQNAGFQGLADLTLANSATRQYNSGLSGQSTPAPPGEAFRRGRSLGGPPGETFPSASPPIFVSCIANTVRPGACAGDFFLGMDRQFAMSRKQRTAGGWQRQVASGTRAKAGALYMGFIHACENRTTNGGCPVFGYAGQISCYGDMPLLGDYLP